MKKVFFASPFYLPEALALLRIVIGGLVAYHGFEVFQPEVMKGYLTWEVFKGDNAGLVVYFGKSTELLAGMLLLFGLFTRVAALLLTCAMCYITFIVGGGAFWYGDQHPFMFVLFGILFLFAGPGKWSVDGFLSQRLEE